jgi:hypothetical protein
MFKYPSSWVNRYCGPGSDKNKTQWFKETIDAIQYWYGAFIISDYIPYLRWVTKLQGIDTSLQALQNQISNFVTKIMDEHRTTPSTPNSNIEDVPKDFMDVLFTMPQEDVEHGNGECHGYFYNSELFMFKRFANLVL